MSHGTIDQVVEWLRITWDVQRQDFGEHLRNKRKKYGLTLQQMAEKIGVSHSQVSRWESGGATPEKSPMILAVAQCYRLNADETRKWLEICSFSELTYSTLASTIVLVSNTLESMEKVSRHTRRDPRTTDVLNHLEDWKNTMVASAAPFLSDELLEIERQLIEVRRMYLFNDEGKEALLQPLIPANLTSNMTEWDHFTNVIATVKRVSNMRAELRQYLAVCVLRVLAHDWKIDLVDDYEE